jgi:hypothetical protein
MKFYFHEDAKLEFDKAIEYYEGCQTGLGLEYAQEIYAAIKRIIQFPEAWPPFSKKNEALPRL